MFVLYYMKAFEIKSSFVILIGQISQQSMLCLLKQYSFVSLASKLLCDVFLNGKWRDRRTTKT